MIHDILRDLPATILIALVVCLATLGVKALMGGYRKEN
jgi:hypothetical protein